MTQKELEYKLIAEKRLIEASENGRLDEVNALLTSCVGMGEDGHWGNCGVNTALIKAGEMGHTEIAAQLLFCGADVNTRDTRNETALIKACSNGHTKTARILLEHGADTGICDIYGSTAIIGPCRWGFNEAASLLLEYGADVNKRNNYGETPLMAASQKGYTEIVKLLLDHGADVNIVDNDGNTALINSCRNCQPDTVLQLLEHNVNINHINTSGNTALTEACIWRGRSPRLGKNTRIIRALLDKGADPNISGGNDWTPIMHLAWTGDVGLIKMLIGAGADTRTRNKNGTDVFDIIRSRYPSKFRKWQEERLKHEDSRPAAPTNYEFDI